MIALMLIVGAALAAGAYYLQGSGLLAPKVDAVGGDVYINEVMSENSSTLVTERGDVPDWIEITNAGKRPVDVGKYSLMLDTRPNRAFSFPSYSLQPGECLLIYAEGMDVGSARGEWSAGFKLSASGGEQLVLLNAQGKAVDAVELPELEPDAAYVRAADGSWSVNRRATPGAPNDSGASARSGVQLSAGALEISEAMSGNTLYFPDENGEYHDYVEIHNVSSEDVNLAGWYLSDASDKLKRWSFPEVALPAGGYLVVHCSGYGRSANPEHLHADFRLSGDGENVYLSRPDGQTVSTASLPVLQADQAYSLVDGAWTTNLAPTPGRENTAEAAAQLNAARFGAQSGGVVINEIMASPANERYDWVEIYNGSGAAVDLSGYGLSDDSERPRRWQFPEGTTLQPGRYLGVYCSGRSRDKIGDVLNADFALSSAGNYTLCLSDAQGNVLDAVYLPLQRGGWAYGRAAGETGFFYFEAGTPGAANAGVHAREWAQPPECSVSGGLFSSGEQLSVALSAPAGSRVYYTLDCSDPDESSTPYAGPIQISDTTILRARVYRDGCMPSLIDTQSYLYDVQNEGGEWIVSIVSDMDNLVGSDGIITNYAEDIEREAHFELFSADGSVALSQGCGLSLHGWSSRRMPVKTFNVIARSVYGDRRFDYPVFAQRDYDSYQSLLLRPSGEDYGMSFMRDTMLSSLMRGSSLMFQEHEIALAYVNGEYYSLYYIRERINKHSICQFEGWEGMENEIDVVRGNDSVTQGSNASFEELLDWVRNNDLSGDAAYDYIASRIDVQNYIEYMAIEIFSGNTDTLNVRRYRNPRTDGKWRWALYDLDWAFFNDTDSIGEWLKPGGAGVSDATDNTLFIACMRNPRFRDEFLTYFGQCMATIFSTEHVLSRIEAQYARLEPSLEQYQARWDIDLKPGIRRLVDYAQTRPEKLINTYFRAALNLSDADMQKYFGEALEAIRAYEAEKGS